MPEDSATLAALRGTAVYSADGQTHLFNFFAQDVLPGCKRTLTNVLPGWFDESVLLIGGLCCGDALLLKEGRLFLMFHDTLEVAPSSLTEAQFYQLIAERNADLDEIIYNSLGDVCFVGSFP